ncbi:hypothetical protein [Nonomuraea sp. NPDC046570]|uniref:hypothetical protein n=1 Tax=Nonomuraea sp. NPDC046570 TaxID=3155255 RepID=UPI0033FD7261
MSGRAVVLPRLVLLVAVLLGIGLMYAGAHLCGPAPSMAGVCAHGDGPAEVVAAQEQPAGENPFVLCLAAISALLIAGVVLVLRLGRIPAEGGGARERPVSLPAVRGSPPVFGLVVQRVAVLRV